MEFYLDFILSFKDYKPEYASTEAYWEISKRSKMEFFFVKIALLSFKKLFGKIQQVAVINIIEKVFSRSLMPLVLRFHLEKNDDQNVRSQSNLYQRQF